jgi:hypothetical protein
MFGYFSTSNNFAELTDINIKQMLFNQRMQEIDQDVLPFGFIDDGLEEIETTPGEVLGQEWAIEYEDTF